MDESIQRKWTINPFAFILAPDAPEIKIDWEHESYGWFDPADVTDEALDGVPRLLESFRRVWLDVDLGLAPARVLEDGLATLKGDHESGARELAAVALGVYIDVLRELDIADKGVWWANVRRVGWHLWKNGRETMGAAILHVVLASLDIIQEAVKGELSNTVVTEVIASIEHLARQRKCSTYKITNAFTTFLEQNATSKPIRIVTLSSSSTIAACLLHAIAILPHTINLQILESRPLYEGAKLAYKLSSAISPDFRSKISITVLTDASAGIAAQDADLLLIGADLIDKHGNVSNKTGSLPAVLAARHVSRSVKVVVVSEKEKVLPFEAPGHEENDATEVSASWGVEEAGVGGVKVRNVYFEWVDCELVDVYVTDEGVAGREDVMRWAGDIARRANSYFEGL